MTALTFDEIPDGCGFRGYSPASDERGAAPDADAVAPALIACSASDSESAATATPDSITGQYRDIHQRYAIDTERVVGEGHLASVRECIDIATGKRRYAVKTTRKSADPRVKLTDLHREVKLLGEVKHDNIARLVDVFEDAEHLHIVTDLYTGGELFDRIVKSRARGRGCFDEGEAATVLRQVLEAVAYLHAHDIVHRGEW